MVDLNEYLKPSNPFEEKEEGGNEPDQKSSLHNTVDYINQQLGEHGYPSPLDLLNGNRESATQIIECIFSLLQQRQKDTGYREALNDQLRRLQSDQDMLMTGMRNLKNRAELSDREVDSLKAKLQWTENTFRIEFEKHRSTKEELTKTKLNLQYIKTQNAHEVRKRESEYQRFKEQMGRALNEKYRGAKIGLKMINPAPKPSVREISNATNCRPTAGLAPSEYAESNADVEMFRQVLADHEARQNELLEENSKLRSLLYEVQTQMTEFLDKQTQMMPERYLDADPEFTGIETPESYNPHAAKFSLPYEMFGQNLEEEVKGALSALKNEWENRPAGMLVELQEKEEEIQIRDKMIQEKDEALHNHKMEIDRKDANLQQRMVEIDQKESEIHQKIMEIERKQEEINKQEIKISVLNEELEEAKNFARQAHELLDQQMKNGFYEGLPDISLNEMTAPEYDQESKDLFKKREQLNTERKQFTESLIRLGKDREAFLQERVDFELEKRRWKAAHSTPRKRVNGEINYDESSPDRHLFMTQEVTPLTPFLEKYQQKLYAARDDYINESSVLETKTQVSRFSSTNATKSFKSIVKVRHKNEKGSEASKQRKREFRPTILFPNEKSPSMKTSREDPVANNMRKPRDIPGLSELNTPDHLHPHHPHPLNSISINGGQANRGKLFGQEVPEQPTIHDQYQLHHHLYQPNDSPTKENLLTTPRILEIDVILNNEASTPYTPSTVNTNARGRRFRNYVDTPVRKSPRLSKKATSAQAENCLFCD
ncbi:hypothetical protein G9A89_016127 [Geosiphon pyriformis]|nr:hypothetical protein G9A89_016127 [Geosiphon pyriformis]